MRTINDYTLYSNESIDKTFNRIIYLNDLNDFEAIQTKKDGNCFYRGISRILFGKENEFYLIKILAIFMLFEYKDHFTNILIVENYGIDFESFVNEQVKENSWANQLMVLATSIFKQKYILLFN